MTPEEENLHRREYAVRDAREDLQKEIEQILADVHHESITGAPRSGVPMLRTTARFASLLGNLYIRAERQTAKVVRLTWGLFWLTLGLLAFTIYLAQDAYFMHKRDRETEHRQVEENHQITVLY